MPHLKVLREARLVEMEKRAQQHAYRLNPETLSEVETWVKRMQQRWEERFSALDIVLEREKKKGKVMHSQPNPALKPLEVMAGNWEMELSNAAFLPDPSATVKGSVSFEWVQGGAFLVMRMGDKLSDSPNAIWLISRDESNPNYTVLYYDARSVSRVYEMSFSKNVWKMWREAPGFWQRFEGTLSKNSKTITAHWEKSSDGINWEHDFDITYTKVD